MSASRGCLAFGVIATAATLIAACSAPTDRPLPPAGDSSFASRAFGEFSPVAPGAQQRKGTLQFAISIPPKSANRNQTQYVSASTESMSVSVAGQAVQTFNLLPSSPGCSIDKKTKGRTCTISALFPSGEQDVAMTLYAQSDGKGAALSAGTATIDVIAGKEKTVSITLDGVAARAVVFIKGRSSAKVTVGVASTLPITVSAYDAQGNLILKPGGYDKKAPVTLALHQTIDAVALSATTVNAPGSVIKLSYGGAPIASATVTVRVNGKAQPNPATLIVVATPTPSPTPSPAPTPVPTATPVPTPIPSTAAGLLYETMTSGAIDVFNPASESTVEWSPVASASAPPAQQIAADVSGNIWIPDASNDELLEWNGSLLIPEGSYVASGAVNGVGIETNGTVYLGDGNAIATYAGGKITPYATVNGTPYDIVVDGSGNVFYTDSTDSDVMEIANSGVTSTDTGIPGGAGTAIALDASGDLAVAADGKYGNGQTSQHSMIAIYPPDSTTAALLFAAQTTPVVGIVYDAFGNLWVVGGQGAFEFTQASLKNGAPTLGLTSLVGGGAGGIAALPALSVGTYDLTHEPSPARCTTSGTRCHGRGVTSARRHR